MFVMKLTTDHFDKLKSGKKIYEVRLNDESRQKIGVGDNIIFKREPDLLDGVIVRVTDVKRFDTFEQMATILSIESIGFDLKNASQVSRHFLKIYSKSDEAKYGVVAFKFEVV